MFHTIVSQDRMIMDIDKAGAKLKLIPDAATRAAVSESLATLRDALTSDPAPRLRLVTSP